MTASKPKVNMTVESVKYTDESGSVNVLAFRRVDVDGTEKWTFNMQNLSSMNGLPYAGAPSMAPEVVVEADKRDETGERLVTLIAENREQTQALQSDFLASLGDVFPGLNPAPPLAPTPTPTA